MQLTESLFETLMDNLSDGVYFVDIHRHIRYWNKAAERITGYAREEVIGHCCGDNILMDVNEAGECLCTGKCPLNAILRDGGAHHGLVYLRHKDGHRVPAQVSAAPVHDSHGVITGAMETFHDCSPMHAALKQVARGERAQYICPVTGVGNRRYAEMILDQRLGDARSRAVSFAAFLIAVDGYEELCARHGEPLGEMLLIMAAKSIANALQSFDSLAHWERGVFLAVLPDAETAALGTVANRIRMLVEHSGRSTSRGLLAVTVSLGCVLCGAHDGKESIIDRAVHLLRESAKLGPARISFDTMN